MAQSSNIAVMGKKKDTSTEEDVAADVAGSLTHKKHKKHKHKKHKRKREHPLNTDGDFSSGDGDHKPSLKLKIKIGGETLGEKRYEKSVAKVIPETASDDEFQIEVGEDGIVPVCGTTTVSVDSDISDEDAWLEALESGKLDEYDELKRMKNPALMTARQRALLESKNHRESHGQNLQMLPLGYKEKEMTEEMIQKRALRAKKRRQQAQEKREKDKKQTIDRLLKKQETKPKASKVKNKKKTEVPKIIYMNNNNGISLSFPVGQEFPLQPQKIKDAPPVRMCGIEGCPNRMKYSCSKTKLPLCSFACYKKNFELFKVKNGRGS